MKLPSPGFLIDAFLQVCRRFPGVMLCAFVGVGTLFALIERGSQEHVLAPVWMVCQLGLPLVTALAAYAESRGWPEQRSWLLQAFGVMALAAYHFTIDTEAPAFEHTQLPQYLTLLLTAHLFAAVAPYLNRRSVRDFWEYNRELFANIIIGSIFTLILYAGLALAILAVDQLFDLNLEERIYMRLFFTLAGIFNTVYFLFHFPKKFEFETTDAGYTAIFKNLCKYILIPVVGLYFLILYTYGGKILATWNLPKGWVSSLVLGFSVAGIFTYLLNFYLPEHDDAAWVRGYRKWFWRVQLPLTVLLFVAIGRRIADYGVTEPRYLVAHLGVWLLAACLYFLFSKHDNIKYIPISLGLFGLVFAFGPFSAVRVAERSQTSRLIALLEKNGRWQNEKLVQGTSIVPTEDVQSITSTLEFLDRRNALTRMPWLPMPVDSFPNSSSAYNTAMRIAEWAGIRDSGTVAADKFLNVSGYYQIGAVSVKGFDSFWSAELYQSDQGMPSEDYPDDTPYFRISDDGRSLEWRHLKGGKTELVESFGLQTVLKDWFAKSDPNGYLPLTAAQTSFDLNGRKGTLRIVVRNAETRQGKDDYKLWHLNGFVFLRKNK